MVCYEFVVYRLCSFFEGEYGPKLMWEKEKLLLMSMSNFFFPTMSAEFLLHSFPQKRAPGHLFDLYLVCQLQVD